MKTVAIYGMQVTEIPQEEKKMLGIKYGLRVLNYQPTQLSDPNINQGFIITKVNRIPVKSLKHFEELFRKKNGVMLAGFYDDGIHDHYYFDHSNS